MNGLKKARIMRCSHCRFVRWKGVGFAGPNQYRKFCLAGSSETELSDNYMDGPLSNCPVGYWREDIEQDGSHVRVQLPEQGEIPCGPADSAAWNEWRRERGREKARREQKPRIAGTVREIGASNTIPADAQTALAVLVAAGHVPGWLAGEIDRDLEQNRTGGGTHAG